MTLLAEASREQLLAALAEQAKNTPSASVRTIKDAAYELLLHVENLDPVTKRATGLPYGTILQRLQVEFPDATTTDKCLRWYQVKLNEHGLKVPFRPRRRAQKKETPQ